MFLTLTLCLDLIMKKIISLCLSLFLCTVSINSIEAQALQGRVEPKISINNRILARINGKSITTYDLVRKMDLTFYKQYPEYVSSNVARFQFYQQGWKIIFDDLITEELVLADAKESKIEASAGDVRQEMEEQFGPNIIDNLDKAGMSLDEAYKIVEAEIILQRTISARVNSKALRVVTPIKIRAAYEEFLQKPENRTLTKWNYRVVTIKDRDILKTEALGKVVYQLLLDGVKLDELDEALVNRKLLGKNSKVTVSKTILNNEKELTENYKDVLAHLNVGMYSQPFPFKSRALKTTVYRIIYVEEIVPGGFPSYKELEPKLKQQLLNDIANKETDAYVEKLRQHYHVRESDLLASIPENYQPFTLN